MDDIKFALKKLYPWASDVNYVSKKGKLCLNLEYRNSNRTRFPDFEECFLIFLMLLIIHGFTSFPCLCFIPNPIWANVLFVILSIGIGWIGCVLDGDCSRGEAVAVWGINLILMLFAILGAWQLQAYEANEIARTLPKFFDFLCKFKF